MLEARHAAEILGAELFLGALQDTAISARTTGASTAPRL
jgi:hypothetical protein